MASQFLDISSMSNTTIATIIFGAVRLFFSLLTNTGCHTFKVTFQC